MWTVCDYPALGLILGLSTHGFRACIACGPAIESRPAKSSNKLTRDQLAKGKKIVFGGGHHWVRRSHPYCRDIELNGRPGGRPCPVRITSDETIKCADAWQVFLRSGGQAWSKEDPVHKHDVRHRSCLDELVYWKVRPSGTQNIAWYSIYSPVITITMLGFLVKLEVHRCACHWILV
jgi:hypothetical protein